VIIDDFSHYSWTFPLCAKSDTFPTLLHFFAWVSTQFGLTVKAVQCDNGREFDNSTSRSFFLTRGVQLRMSCPYTFPQNGKAERMIRTTNDVMRTLLIQASLPPRFWAESLHTASYLLNSLPSTASPAPTPHHALFGTPPSYAHLRVFGCACYPNLAATAPHKLAPRSTRCVFLGYSPDHKGYRCYDLASRRVLISRHVVFDESDFPFFSSFSTPTPDPDIQSMFSDPMVQPPVSVFPFPAGPSGTPPALAPILSLLLHLSRFRCHSSHLTWAWCLRPRHARPRRPSPCHTRLRCLLLRHARPRHLLHATPSTCRCLHCRCLLQLLHQRCS
jgi:hypothetical protein